MRRRSLVLLVSAIALGVLGAAAVAAVLLVTRTEVGREKLRGVIEPFIAKRIPGGTVHIGKLGGNLITEITVDSFAIRDRSGELFVSTGRVTMSIDPRDFAEQRIFIRRVRVEHPWVHLVQHEDNTWNFKRIFASKDREPPRRVPKPRAFGDYIVVDSTWARNGTVLLTMPWHPDSALAGAARDSSIRAHLENPVKTVTRRADGYGRTYSWANVHGLLRHARIADPDSNRFGRRFIVDTLSADEFEPTFLFRNLSGDVRHLGDTIWVDIPHFDMPASTGEAAGRVWWGGDLPVRYDIAVRGDSVSLDDVNWVYPDLPRTGGGKLDLLIRNDPKNLRVVDFHLRDMDVRSTKSHLTGNMSFGTGAPVLLVRNVDLRANPVDFDLLRTLAGKPFPYDWQGQLIGTVKARGGPLTRFMIDDARAEFRDAHVRGAVSRFRGRGELDILMPAFTEFHGFRVDASTLDLRTIQFINSNFPKLGGTISGSATLDSSWLDVRFSDASITHQDGPGEPSRFAGSGRITYGDSLMAYDVALEAQALSLTMLARSYPAMPFRGIVSGPVRAKGQAPALDVKTSLQGNAGALSFDGRLDIDSIGGYAARGQGNFSDLDAGALLDDPKLSRGLLSGRYDADISGATATLLRGHLNLDLAGTVIDSVRTYPSRARLAFGDGQVRIVDSLRLQTGAATFVARGAFGLPHGRADSLMFSITADSLGGLRRYLAPRDSARLATAGTSADSLSGSGEFKGIARGTMDAFSVSGRLVANDIYMNKDRSDSLSVRVDLRGLPAAPAGRVEGRASAVTLGGIVLDTIGARVDITDLKNARFTADVASHNGPRATAAGRWEQSAGISSVFVESLGLAVADSRWRLQAPARIALDSGGGLRIDSLVLRNRDSAAVAVIAEVPAVGAAFARLHMTHVPLADAGVVAQLPDALTGMGEATVSVTGTKTNPQIAARVELRGVQWRKLDVERVTAGGGYRSGRVDVQADVVRGGKTALSARANLPADVTLFSVRPRNDSISATLVADNTDLGIVKGLSPVLAESKLTGRLNADVRVGGTLRAPVVDGTVSVADGQAFVPQLGATFLGINGSVIGARKAGGHDSLWVTLSASSETSDGKPSGRARLQGFVKNLLQARNQQQSFDLRLEASAFHAFNRRSVADLYLSTPTPVRLRGTTQSPTLNGAIRVDRGAIYLADRELARKRPLDVFADSVASPEASGNAMFNTLMTNLRVPDLTVTLGEDVRLRSAEANVRLAGSLRVLTSTDRARRTIASSGNLIPTFDVEGELQTVGGSYNLDLGLAQREFAVLSDGTVTFDGDPKNPLLDIRAQHNVRRPGDRDLGVIVNVHGRLLPFPKIDFSSTADYAIAQSDLISYLVIGRAGFDYAANQPALQILASFIAPTASAMATDRLRQAMGSWVDAFQLQFGASGGAAATNLNAGGLDIGQYLLGTTIGAERQFKNVFVNVNTGFCGFQSGQNFNPSQSFGAKAEYRFDPRLNFKIAYDPPTSGRVCNQQGIIGLVNTPPQFSLSFSHTWRF